MRRCWGEGTEDRRHQSTGTGDRDVHPESSDSMTGLRVRFLNLGCALELLGEFTFKYRQARLSNTLECFVEGLKPQCFRKAPKIILGL